MAEHIAYMKRIVDMTIPSILHEYHEMFKQRREAVLRHRQLISASSIVPEEGQPSTSKHLRHSHDESHIHTSNHFEIDALLSSWNHHGSHPQHHAQIHMLQNYIVDLRREDGIEHGHRRKFHRVFVRAIDSGEYGKLGWIVSSDVEHCMICYKHFETVLMSKKHHCRTCGNVVCRDCSIRQDFVEEIANIGMVRICQLCDYGQVRPLHCLLSSFGFV